MIRDHEVLNILLDSVRRFVRERLVPAEAQVAESDQIPASLIEEMKAMGLFGLTIPEEYGGLGLSAEEEVLTVFELCQTSPAFRSMAGTNLGIGSQGILIDGTQEQKQTYLPKMASGEYIASFALTEPGSGSDAASLQTTAIKDGDNYIVNGTKRYITNAPEASVFTLMARTDPGNRRAGGISAFIVDAGSKGIALGVADKKMGLKGSHTCDVIFEDCVVPAKNIIGGKPGLGFKTAMKTLDKGRMHIAAICVGVAQRILNDALKYAIERRQFGQPIANFQLVQAMLADSKTELYAARAMVVDVARRRDDGLEHSTEAACAKLFASEMCGRVADRAIQILGGAGYMVEYGMERFYRDVRILRIYEGTSQIQQLVIAKNMIREFAG